MISTLLFLFVISLVITLAGFLLTARNRQLRDQRRTASFARDTSSLRQGTSSLRQGTNTLRQGTTSLRQGTSSLRQGTSTLRPGTTSLRQGTSTLRPGTTGLRQGAIPARSTRPRPLVAAYEEPHIGASSWMSMLTLLDMRSIFTATGAKRQTPWLGILFLLIMFFAVGLYSIHSLLPGNSFGISPAWMNSSASAQSALPTVAAMAPINSEYTQLVANVSGASKTLRRVSQLDPAQYASTQEFDTWAYSACSAAAMTEVINSYGHSYRVTDILSVEARIGEITAAQGLLEPSGIDHTVRQFGFKTVSIPNTSLDNLISLANGGRPIIVSFPPARWDGGHILVLRGGDGSSVYLADSSRLNMTVMTRAKFLSYWGGYAVLAVPQNA